jgi:hypothetical protein
MTNRDRYDAIVLGGGLAGSAAAWTLGTAGYRVAVLEPTGWLGREVTLQRLQAWSPVAAGSQSRFAAAFADALVSAGGLFDGQIDPFASARALDDLLAECGAQTFFHYWPTSARVFGSGIEIGVATKDGRSEILTDAVIDASRFGRLFADHADAVDGGDAWSRLEFFFANVTDRTDHTWSLRLGPVSAVATRQATPWNGEVRYTVRWQGSWGVNDLPELTRVSLDGLLAGDSSLLEAVFLGASDEAASDHRTRYIPPRDTSVVLGAGPWLAEFHSSVADEGRYSQELITIGELTALQLQHGPTHSINRENVAAEI